MSYYKMLFFGGGGDIKNENKIKDENKASYIYVQSVCINSTPKMILGT